MKYCRNCKIETDRRKDGACKLCVRISQRRWVQNNLEKNRAQKAAWHRSEKGHATSARYRAANLEKVRAKECRHRTALKTKVYDHYGAFCHCCGETELSFLVLDHINNDGSVQRKVHGKGHHQYRWIVKNKFPADFQVLCSNCNQSKKMNGGVCIHQVEER